MAKFYMRWRVTALFSCLVLLTVGGIHFLLEYPTDSTESDLPDGKPMGVEGNGNRDEIHLATVSCARSGISGEKDFKRPLTLSLTMMKSAAMFAKKTLNLHIFTDDEMKTMFETEIESWPASVRQRVSYSIYSADYSPLLPKNLIQEWHAWYKPCGSFRLFLPLILASKTTAAIYSDNDVVFIKPLDELWGYLDEMNDRQVVGISPTTGHSIDVRNDNVNFISGSSGNIQINSGVMLMNFDRMLNADWKLHDASTTKKYGTELLLSYYNKFKDSAEHDQKLLNIMFHYNPEFLHELPCSWNFKNNFCTNDKNICEDAERNGAGAVHGISGSFFGNGNPTFKGLYETFVKYKLGGDVNKKLFKRYIAYLGAYASNTYCGKKAKIIVNTLKKSLSNVDFRK